MFHEFIYEFGCTKNPRFQMPGLEAWASVAWAQAQAATGRSSLPVHLTVGAAIRLVTRSPGPGRLRVPAGGGPLAGPGTAAPPRQLSRARDRNSHDDTSRAETWTYKKRFNLFSTGKFHWMFHQQAAHCKTLTKLAKRKTWTPAFSKLWE